MGVYIYKQQDTGIYLGKLNFKNYALLNEYFIIKFIIRCSL